MPFVMHYKRLDNAFLFEFAVGLLTLYCVFAMGAKGMVALAVGAFRPLVLKISPEPVDQPIWRLYYEALRWGLLLTGVTILLTYFLFDYLPVNSHDRAMVFLTTIPWFMVIHGMVGFIIVWPKRQGLS